jgi:hypothetical protein
VYTPLTKAWLCIWKLRFEAHWNFTLAVPYQLYQLPLSLSPKKELTFCIPAVPDFYFLLKGSENISAKALSKICFSTLTVFSQIEKTDTIIS